MPKNYNPTAIKLRDRFTCLRCKAEGDYKSLEVHHLVGRGRLKRGANVDINHPANLISLCWECHKLVTDHQCYDWDQWEVVPTTDMENDLWVWWTSWNQRYAIANHPGCTIFRDGFLTTLTPRTQQMDRFSTLSDIEVHAHRGESIRIEDPMEVSAALAKQDGIKELIHDVSVSHTELALNLYELHQKHWWRVNHETLGEYLMDPEVGLSRDGYYRLVGLGRLLDAHPDPASLPILNATLWQKAIVPLAKIENGKLINQEEIEHMAHLAATLPRADFEHTVRIRKDDGFQCPLDGSEMIYDPQGNLIGFVDRAWASSRGVHIKIRLDTRHTRMPLVLEIRRGTSG